MQNIFFETESLDRRCYERYALTEDLLMEHAARAMQEVIASRLPEGGMVLIVCGPGNNGADGIALARLLHGAYEVQLHLAYGPKSPMAVLQLERTKRCGITPVNYLGEADLIVDCLFGSGLSKPLETKTQTLIKKLNTKQGIKIACDFPSGLFPDGRITPESTFQAEVTVTMGGLKRALFSDAAKDCAGEIVVANLGVDRSVYETESDWKLLETRDLRLPSRDRLDSHKGSYGHLAVLVGEKPGAGVLAAQAGFRYGAGLVSVIGGDVPALPLEIMQSDSLPEGTSAAAVGMGLGANRIAELDWDRLVSLPLVVDADLFTFDELPSLLPRLKQAVLTPHPKEFVSLLKHCQIAELTVAELQNNRFEWVEKFTETYPEIVLLLKGANVIIARGERKCINPLGAPVLAKGGSGDVLSGLIGALLAQGWSPLESAIQGSLAHVMAARRCVSSSYALTPQALIESAALLECK